MDRYTDELLFSYELAEIGSRVDTAPGAGVVEGAGAAGGGLVDAGESTGTGAAGDAAGEVQAVRRANKMMMCQGFKRIVRFPNGLDGSLHSDDTILCTPGWPELGTLYILYTLVARLRSRLFHPGLALILPAETGMNSPLLYSQSPFGYSRELPQ